MTITHYPWWRHQMEIFSALLAICEGNSPVTGEFPKLRPVTRSFDVYFDLRPNERLSKQWWGWWFETPSRSLWRHRNASQKFFSGEWLTPTHQQIGGGCLFNLQRAIYYVTDYQHNLNRGCNLSNWSVAFNIHNRCRPQTVFFVKDIVHTDYWGILSIVWPWRSNYLHFKVWGISTHPWPNFSFGFGTPPLGLWHVWVIISHINLLT